MIELFPDRMLDGSVHTAILIGVICLWLMTESFGFVFAGFVVIGYLAAIGIVAPMSLVAIVVEAVLTYGVVWAIGPGLARAGAWSRVFGRERFLLFVVASVPVRLLVEGLAAPGFELMLHPLLEDPEWRGSRFFGIGIVLVPLLANVFWKPGLARGLLQVALGTSVTFAALQFVLIPFTNFEFSGFELAFERVAVDFLAAPKTYIVLVVTAFVAARNNLRYGWDFGGILVPALLAIVALTPTKLLTTLVEVVALVWLYRMLVTLPWVRDLNLEGPRRIVTMYSVSYALKWAIALVALAWLPRLQVSDLYGFGYLLTSLVALRCYQRGNTARTLAALMITVGQGLAVALGLSLALTLVMPPRPPDHDAVPEPLGPEMPIARSILLAQASVRSDYPWERRAEWELEVVVGALREVVSGGDPGRAAEVFRAHGLDVGWVVRDDAARCLAVRPDREDGSAPPGLPSVWWCGGAGPGLYVPRPVGDPDSLWVAAALAQGGQFSFVVVDGIDASNTALIGVDDRRVQVRWSRVRDVFGSRSALAVRTVPDGSSWLDPRSAGTTRALREAGRIPLGPDRSGVPVRFGSDHGALEPLWRRMKRRDGLLTVSLDEAGALVEAPSVEPTDLDLAVAETRGQPDVRRRDPSDPAHRLVATQLVLGGMFRLARSGQGTPEGLAWAAEHLGLVVHRATDAQGRTFWLVRETDEAPTGWGTWVIRDRAPGPWLVMAPLSADERGTAELAEVMFHRTQAESLWISGHAARYGVGDPLSGGLERLPVAQLAMREALVGPEEGAGTRLLVLRRQPRGGQDVAPVVASVGAEMLPGEATALAALRPHLADWPGLALDQGARHDVATSASGQFPVRYLDALTPGNAVVLWFDPALLAEVGGGPLHAQRIAWYTEHGVPVHGPGVLDDLDPSRPVERARLGALLRHHVDTLDRASLLELRGTGELSVVDTGTRLVTVVRGGDWACAAVARAPVDARLYPVHGCWGLR